MNSFGHFLLQGLLHALYDARRLSLRRSSGEVPPHNPELCTLGILERPRKARVADGTMKRT